MNATELNSHPPGTTTDGPGRLQAAGAILLGIAINFVANGYQFGLSNHSVYLIDALRQSDPSLLANDWFYTQTLQYHSAFGWLTAALLKLNILEPAFAGIYAILLVVFHVAWRSLTGYLGGDDRTYLLSVILYFISAGGIGLGTYQFFQDSSVLASNVANVAMFVGIVAFVGGRWILVGVGFSVAALFHLNHAAVCLFLWAALALTENRLNWQRWTRPGFFIATLPILTAAAANILPAAMAKLGRPGSIPLAEFVDLYARLRHPHHYDPSTWPFAQWLAFCIWIVPAAVAIRVLLRGDAPRAVTRTVTALLAVMMLQIAALLFAGIFYISETLVQLSLFRFSIIAHVLLVVLSSLLLARLPGIGWLLPALMAFALAVTMLSPMAHVARERIGPVIALIVLGFSPLIVGALARRPAVVFGMGLMIVVTLLVASSTLTGLTRPLVRVDADYRALCNWAADPGNTPTDAIFLTPPTDEDFRWFARRAIVVNWKSMTQLGSEIPEWRDRMSASLGSDDLSAIPRRSYIRAVEAMRARYDALEGDLLFRAARRYRARYVVATHRLGADFEKFRVGPAFGRYLLYDLTR